MRCWQCDSLIVLPEIVNGLPGEAGMIRAGKVDRALSPQSVTVEFSCGRCGAIYNQTTVRKPGKVDKTDEPLKSDEERERDRVWRG